MSLRDEVRTFEQTVVRRLRELEPLLGEYKQLRTLAQRLGISYSPDEQGTAATSASTRRAGSATKRSQPARSAAKGRTPRAALAKRASRRSAAGTATGRAAGRPTAAAKPAAAAAKSAKTRAAPSRGRTSASARPGQRSDELLRLVGEQPGITVRAVGERLGVNPTGLYRVANKLTADGRLRKDGTKLYPVDAGGSAPEPATTASAASDAGAPPKTAGDHATSADTAANSST
jgi:hypothetical protein